MTGKEYEQAHIKIHAKLWKVLNQAREDGLSEIDGWYRHHAFDGTPGGWVQDTAYISEDSSVQDGSFVLDGATVASESKVGWGCIIGGESSIRASSVSSLYMWGGSIKNKSIVEGPSYGGNFKMYGGEVTNHAEMSGRVVMRGGKVDNAVLGDGAHASEITGGYVHASRGNSREVDIGIFKIHGGEISGDNGKVWIDYPYTLRVKDGDFVDGATYKRFTKK